MKYVVNFLMMSVVSFAIGLPIAYADDGPNAQCHVREKQEEKKKKTGSCTVTESNGQIWIVLKNGESITLKPGKKKEHFRDQRDKVAKRSYEAGVAVYKWEKKTIKVNLDAS
ncbi:MAG: hypothetical protein ACR2QL_11920 [Woeseiaceae bacterium]